MRKHSIFFKLNLLFLIALLTVGFFLSIIYRALERREDLNFVQSILMTLRSGGFPNLQARKDMKLLSDPKEIQRVTTRGEVLMLQKFPQFRVVIYDYRGNKYFLFVSGSGMFMIEKVKKISEIRALFLAVFFISAFSMAALYLSIIRSINPLRVLQKKIKKFREGDLEVSFDIGRQDEIGDVAIELDKAVKGLKKITAARQLFLRNIAHELKTPITKGKLAVELLEDERKKEILSGVFNRLETLVGELLTAESIAVGDVKLRKMEIPLKELIEKSLNLLLQDKEGIEIQVPEDVAVNVDPDMFSVALKNLIDNGLKFSEDGKVRVYYTKGRLEIANRGEKVSIPEEYMFEPFSKEVSERNRSGLGLGLYIVRYILDTHGVSVSYRYEKGENIFTLDLTKVLVQPNL